MNLVRYDAACQAIAAAKTTDEVKDIRDKAEAMRAYGRQAKNRQLEIDAAEIRMRAERRLGEIIVLQKEMVGLHQGGRPTKTGTDAEPVLPRLSDVGIDKKLSSRAQKMAAVPPEEFENIMNEWRDDTQAANERVTTNLLKAADIKAKRSEYEERIVSGGTVGSLESLIDKGQKFAAIYADPPWAFKVYSGKGKQRSADRHYDTMSLDDISTLPIEGLALDDCALFLWAVLPELPGALQVIEAWGFTYKTCAFTWIKQNRSGDGIFTGMGYWTRANAEVCLLATRGAPQRLAKDVHQVIMSPVSEHSRKPDEARERIMRLVGGPYLELFSRQPHDDWTVWGNEV